MTWLQSNNNINWGRGQAGCQVEIIREEVSDAGDDQPTHLCCPGCTLESVCPP